jgi:hypothetical protein
MLALTGAGTANAAPAASEDKTAPVVASAKVDSTGAAEYWTPDRMRAAVPGDVLAGAATERPATATDAVDKGKPTKVKPLKPTKASKATKAKPQLSLEAEPVAHIGKVFFTLAGQNYVCSGNAVSSENGSTVATAGHCLNGGPGMFATNFTFVPAYKDGAAPYGAWTARELYTTTQWEQTGDVRYDTGFAVMNPIDGQSLTDVVGGSGVEFNADRGMQYTSYGFPAAKPFTGERLWSCSGTATNDATHPEFETQGIPCNMTGGSSGGPWFLGGSSEGYQNSINSYGYNGSNVMYGPYWGSVIQDTYDIAEAA